MPGNPTQAGTLMVDPSVEDLPAKALALALPVGVQADAQVRDWPRQGLLSRSELMSECKTVGI